MDRRRLLKLTSVALASAVALPTVVQAQKSKSPGLWGVWDSAFARARFVSLSHVLAPNTPVWSGFPTTTKFQQGTGRLDEKSPYAAFTYEKTGLETTAYAFATDQFGTQLDPPAHWHQCFPAIDELPATLALRKLAVISIADKVAADPNYHLTAADIAAWERAHGMIPAGSVVMVRSDWSKRWPDPELAKLTEFPGVSLAALQFLHLQRHILFHGHEPLDTDSTPTLEGEAWLMHHGYAQAEGVDNLDAVPAKGCLINIGYPKFRGGLGGYARYVAICPPGTRGERIPARERPLPTASPLHFDAALGYRVR